MPYARATAVQVRRDQRKFFLLAPLANATDSIFVILTLLSVPEITGIKSGHGGMAEFGMVKADKHKKLNYRKGPNRSAVFSCCNV